MYTPSIAGLGDLAAILAVNDRLTVNQRYTFTFDTNQLLNLASESDVRSKLQYFLGPNYGDVVGVTRPLFSGRYLVTVVPKAAYPLSAWLNAFNYAWSNMPGFESITWRQTEGGVVSTVPGGIIGAAQAGQEAAAKAVEELDLKGMLMWAAIGVIGLAILIPTMQSSLAARRS